jgi:uncharacterized protein (TIGR03437 family)
MRFSDSSVSLHAPLMVLLLLSPGFAQDSATPDKITSTVNAAVTSASVREFCICNLLPAIWGNIDTRVLVDRTVTSDKVDRIFRITGGLFYNETSSTRPSGLAEYTRSGAVLIPSAEVAFQRGAPFFVSAPSLQNNGASLSYTLISNPAIQLSNVFPRYQRITTFSDGSTLTSEVVGSNQPVASSANPQPLTWQFSSPITASGTQYFAMVTYGQVNGSSLRCLQSNEVDLVALLKGSSPPAITGVSNNASGQVGIASGSWVSIYGTNLSATTRSWQNSDFSGNNLPTILDGVGVKINGKSAAVYYVSPGQLNVQAPTDSSLGSVQVQVTNSSGSATGTATLQTFAPGLFTFQGKYVAAVHTDGAYVAPTGYLGSGATTRPAQPGETLSIFGTGFGPTTPAVPAGQIFSGAAPLSDSTQLSIVIGGMPATVKFAGLVAAGEYQFNVVIPALPDGDHAMIATAGGVSSQSGLLISIKQ